MIFTARPVRIARVASCGDDVERTSEKVRRPGFSDSKPVNFQQLCQQSRVGVVSAIETDVQVADDVDRITVAGDSVKSLRQVVEEYRRGSLRARSVDQDDDRRRRM